jgi:hypothetical protein
MTKDRHPHHKIKATIKAKEAIKAKVTTSVAMVGRAALTGMDAASPVDATARLYNRYAKPTSDHHVSFHLLCAQI